MNNIPIIVFGFIVLFFVWRGYKNGFAISIARYFSCLLAYLISVIYTNPLGKIIYQNSNLDGLIVYFMAAGFIFLTVSMAVNYIIGKLLDAFFKDDLGEEELISDTSKFSGAFSGLLAGCFVGLLIVYVMSFSQKIAIDEKQNHLVVSTQNLELTTSVDSVSDANAINISDNQEIIPEPTKEIVQDSFIDSVAKKVVSKTITTAVDLTTKNSTTKTISKVLSNNPEKAFDNLKQFINNKDVVRALANSDLQSLLKRGDSEKLLKNAEFQTLIHNKNIKILFGEEKEEVVAKSMIVVWNRVEEVKDNKRVIEIVSDPEFIKQINSANTAQLLMNPQLKELTEIIAGKQ